MSRIAQAAVTDMGCLPAPVAASDWTLTVGEFPSLDYSMKDVLRAGEALAGKMIWTEETAPRIREVFSIASNWRDSHAYPMRKVRNLVYQKIRRLKQSGNTVARLKHMPSIRRKLRDQPWKLNQIQDLAGCRAILPTIDGVNALIEALRRNSCHVIHREDPYINSPKPDGYRCHHIVYKFQGVSEEEVFNGRRVEIQVRTRLQHSWATAVETVGLFRQENMKGGLGNQDWLRLFKLMSAEFAVEEGCPEPPEVSGGDARIREIIQLEKAPARRFFSPSIRPIKVSSASTISPAPPMGSIPTTRMASRMRCAMNHAVLRVTPKVRESWLLEMPFFDEHSK
jgi:Region found in RelA / SpoT proteins